VRPLDPLTRQWLRRAGLVAAGGPIALVAFVVVVGPWLDDREQSDEPRLSPAEVRPVLDAIEADVRAIPPFGRAELRDVTQTDECTGDSVPEVWISISYALPAGGPLRSNAIFRHYRRQLERNGWRQEAPGAWGSATFRATRLDEAVALTLEVDSATNGSTTQRRYTLFGTLSEPVCPVPYL